MTLVNDRRPVVIDDYLSCVRSCYPPMSMLYCLSTDRVWLISLQMEWLLQNDLYCIIMDSKSQALHSQPRVGMQCMIVNILGTSPVNQHMKTSSDLVSFIQHAQEQKISVESNIGSHLVGCRLDSDGYPPPWATSVLRDFKVVISRVLYERLNIRNISSVIYIHMYK